jgi:hypothetical protein
MNSSTASVVKLVLGLEGVLQLHDLEHAGPHGHLLAVLGQQGER